MTVREGAGGGGKENKALTYERPIAAGVGALTGPRCVCLRGREYVHVAGEDRARWMGEMCCSWKRMRRPKVDLSSSLQVAYLSKNNMIVNIPPSLSSRETILLCTFA